MSILDHIETIVVVMLENRSFDHVLGYLSLPPHSRLDVDGLSMDPAFSAKYSNIDPATGIPYAPVGLTLPSQKLAADPPHERTDIAVQIGNNSSSYPKAGYPMDGFVKSCPTLQPENNSPLVMGFYTGTDLPTTDFFAQNYAVCDHWFASLPSGTQPNRLMAMSGFSKIDGNRSFDLPNQELVFDWLDARKIRWRVYHDGLPFLSLMPRMIEPIVLGRDFRSYSEFRLDNKQESQNEFPQVVFIEPRYTNAPHLEPATDDHPPSPISNGQQFLLKVYSDLAANPQRWMKSMLIVTYDEHGGFFDHVSPLPTLATGSGYKPFISTGVRVPGFVISPYVQAGTVFSENLDHTAVLKLLAKKFDSKSRYSDVVDKRMLGGKPVADLSKVLTRSKPRSDIPFPAQFSAGFLPGEPPPDKTGQALKGAWNKMKRKYPQEVRQRFPELLSKF